MAQRNPTLVTLTDIFEERLRQVHELGHTPERDAELYGQGALARAAAARLVLAASLAQPPEDASFARSLRDMAIILEPWSSAPAILRAPPRRLLIEAGALAAAELERRLLIDAGS